MQLFSHNSCHYYFYERASTPAIIKYGMDILKKATQFLNPGQIPVILLDAPLFAVAKLVQWNWPYTHSEKDFVVMFGSLHIETAIWKTLGDYLESLGRTSALVQAGVASADSYLTLLGQDMPTNLVFLL